MQNPNLDLGTKPETRVWSQNPITGFRSPKNGRKLHFLTKVFTVDYLLRWISENWMDFYSKLKTQTGNPGLAMDSNSKPGLTIWRVFTISKSVQLHLPFTFLLPDLTVPLALWIPSDNFHCHEVTEMKAGFVKHKSTQNYCRQSSQQQEAILFRYYIFFQIETKNNITNKKWWNPTQTLCWSFGILKYEKKCFNSGFFFWCFICLRLFCCQFVAFHETSQTIS